MKRSSMMWVGLMMIGCGGSAPSAEYAERPISVEGQAPAGASAEIEKATSAIEAGDFPRAKALLEGVLQRDPSHGTAAYYLGVVLESLDDAAGAEQRYRDALRLNPELAEAAINLGALYIDGGRFDEAVEVSRGALKKRANDAALQANLAMALQGQGKTDDALAEYARAVQAAGDNATLRFQYASLLLESGKKPQAADELRSALRSAGTDRALLASIGRGLGAASAFSDCVTAFDRAIEAGDAAELRVGRGLCRHSLDDEAAARADFASAVALAPESAPAHYYLGRSLLALGQRKEAIASLETAARLAKDSPLAKKALEEAAAARKKR